MRFYRSGATEDEEARTGLARVVDVAARQGDSRGDERQAIVVLDAGIARHPDAPPAERFEAITYRAELKLRIGLDASDDLVLAAELISTNLSGYEATQRLNDLREQATSG